MHRLVRSRHILILSERSVLDAIPVDLADIEVNLHFCNVRRGDPVRGAPDFGRGGSVLVCEGFPDGAVDEGYDAAGGFGGAAVVLAGSVSVGAWFALRGVGGLGYLACRFATSAAVSCFDLSSCVSYLPEAANVAFYVSRDS